MKIDPDLKQFATARQAEILDAMEKHGSIRKAAAALGISKSTVDSAYERVKALAARKGHAPGHWTGGIAPGYTMGKGYRSLRDTRSIVIHRDFGEIGRHVCSIAMLRP